MRAIVLDHCHDCESFERLDIIVIQFSNGFIAFNEQLPLEWVKSDKRLRDIVHIITIAASCRINRARLVLMEYQVTYMQIRMNEAIISVVWRKLSQFCKYFKS